MKSNHKYPVLILLILLTVSIKFSEAEIKSGDRFAEKYNTAASLYNNEKYLEALVIYEELMSGGIKNSDLYYNASDAAFRAGSLGKAILYIERAARITPSDADIRANLSYLNGVKKDREQVPDAVNEFISNTYNSIDINVIALFSGISFALTALLFSVIVILKAWKNSAAIVFSVLFSLVFATSTLVFAHRVWIAGTISEAVIMEEEVSAYSGPGIDNTLIFTIHEGTKVVVERSINSWNLVRLKSGAGGWINSASMVKI